jgi:thiamine biosynthesis lipoprotein
VIAQAGFPALGSQATVSAEASRLERAREAVEAEVRAIDLACSRFRADSELTALNRSSGGPFTASSLLMEVVEVALRAARATDGAVDPTVGAAMLRIGYDDDFELLPLGRPGGRLDGLAVPGWRQVRLARSSRTVFLPAGVQLDLGATAKALAADRAAAAAHQAVRTGVLVNLGGDLAAGGPSPEGGWRVLIAEDHRTRPDMAGPRIVIRSGGLATSSTTVRRWEVGGLQHHHLVDPATGLPTQGPWRTVSVAAASCVDANAAATASIVKGESAVGWLAAHRLPARLVAQDGRVVRINGWPEETAETAT